MAKGLRSKSMRKNRTYLRETLVKPIMKERQAKLAEAMRNKIEEQTTSTLLNLKKLIPNGNAEEIVPSSRQLASGDKIRQTDLHAQVEEEDEDNMNTVEDESEEEEELNRTSKNFSKKGKNTKLGSKKTVVKSSRRPAKEMFWFK